MRGWGDSGMRSVVAHAGDDMRTPRYRPCRRTGVHLLPRKIAGMVWALENPQAGLVEADELDFRRCLEVQLPYLGLVIGVYTDWTPLEGRGVLFPENIDREDAWQFSNVIVR